MGQQLPRRAASQPRPAPCSAPIPLFTHFCPPPRQLLVGELQDKKFLAWFQRAGRRRGKEGRGESERKERATEIYRDSIRICAYGSLCLRAMHGWEGEKGVEPFHVHGATCAGGASCAGALMTIPSNMIVSSPRRRDGASLEPELHPGVDEWRRGGGSSLTTHTFCPPLLICYDMIRCGSW